MAIAVLMYSLWATQTDKSAIIVMLFQMDMLNIKALHATSLFDYKCSGDNTMKK